MKVSAISARRSSAFLLSPLLGAGKPDGVEAVQPFDAQRYKGEWFKIMRLDHSFERGLTNVTATYAPRDHGFNWRANRGFDRAACRWNEAEGRAVFQGAPDTASLSVTFFWPFAGGYHVIALDQRDYRWALVCGPSRNYLSILARRADLSSEIKDRLIVQASGPGFPVENLILVDHSPPGVIAKGLIPACLARAAHARSICGRSERSRSPASA